MLWRLRKIKNSGEQQSILPLAGLLRQEKNLCTGTQKLSPCDYIPSALGHTPRQQVTVPKQHLALATATQAPSHPAGQSSRSKPHEDGPLLRWLTQGEGHEEFHQGFDSCQAVGWMCLTHPMVKERKTHSQRQRNCTCLGFMQRLKIPTTCSLLAPTCLYRRDCWVMAAQPRNLRQKHQVSHARGLGCVLYAAGSQAREDLEHAKFKANSRETSEATSCCWELPCHFFLFVPIPHGLLLTGWRVLYTEAPQDWSLDSARNRKAPGWLLHKDLETMEGKSTPQPWEATPNPLKLSCCLL